MKTHDPSGRDGPKTPLPDVVVVHTPKEDDFGFPAGGKDGDKVSRTAATCLPASSLASPRTTSSTGCC